MDTNFTAAAFKFASALGIYEGNLQFILKHQSQLTKEQILQLILETCDKANKEVARKWEAAETGFGQEENQTDKLSESKG